jgi:hypothetical protein
MSPDLGPSSDSIEDKVYNEAMWKTVKKVDAIKNQSFPNEPMNWPTFDNLPMMQY